MEVNTIGFSEPNNFSGTQITNVKVKAALAKKRKRKYAGNDVETGFG
jgi:hypothetical protein